MDVHEPREIKIELEKNGLKIEVKKLNVGDYAFNGYRIERKEVKDFMNSIYSRRLYEQLYNLQQAEHPILIIVGTVPPDKQWIHTGKRKYFRKLTYEERMKKYRTIRKNMIIAYTSYNIQVFHAIDDDDFIEFITNLYYSSTRKGEKLRPIKRKSKSLKNIKIDILGCIPGIGKKLAKDISEKYSIRKFFNLSEKELCKISGIGKTIARKIEECVTYER
jgi:ERCC4-type nuclease